MQYTKPNVLSTTKANAAIQTGNGSGAKLGVQLDSKNQIQMNSTTGAYEADE
jgi:hypothetical protein